MIFNNKKILPKSDRPGALILRSRPDEEGLRVRLGLGRVQDVFASTFLGCEIIEIFTNP